MILHLKMTHSIRSGDAVSCKQPGCLRKFSDVWSFKKHLERKHDFFDSVTISVRDDTKSNEQNVEENPPCISNFDEMTTNENQDTSNASTSHQKYSLQDVINTVDPSAVSLCAKMYENPAIPRNQVQFVIDTVSDFLNCGAIAMISQNLKMLQSSQSSDWDDIFQMLMILENPFEELSTEKRRFDFFQRSSYLIKPISFIVGHTEISRTLPDRSFLDLEGMSAHYIPLGLVLQHFFELPNVFQTVLSTVEQCKKESLTVSSFMQSMLWKEMVQKFPGKLVLPIIIYHDDFEVYNPLGSHAGIHKLGGTYFTTPVIPLENLSTLDNIFLAQLSHSSDRSQFGNRAIFKKLLEELKLLETNGITIHVDGKDFKLYFAVALILGDNLGLNGILGFKESFAGDYYCRICTADRQQCQKLCKSDPELKRTSHYPPAQDTNFESKGVKEECIWDELSYKINQNFACDVMHDLFEVVCRYEIGQILNYFISENCFTLRILNERIKFFKYGRYDSNKPPLISLDHIRKKYIIMSASELACLCTLFGLHNWRLNSRRSSDLGYLFVFKEND